MRDKADRKRLEPGIIIENQKPNNEKKKMEK